MANHTGKESSKFSDFIPSRYILSFLIFWAIFLEYAHRTCLSIAIVAMVNQTENNFQNSREDDNVCPTNQPKNLTLLSNSGQYLWSPTTQGIILGAYFYGYVCSQLLGGRLAEIFGGKWLLGSAILFGSLLTLVTPVASDAGVVAITAVRIIMGLIHGICIPTAYAMFAFWAPVRERSTLIATSFTGGHVGMVLSMPLVGYLCENGFAGGWPSAFYVLGILGCIWFVFWCFLAYSKPADHPRITKQEMEYIEKDQHQYPAGEKSPVPWKSILTSLPVWSTAVVVFSCGWGQITLVTKLPTYLEAVLHVPIQLNGIINSLIHVCCCITTFLSGYSSDYLRSKKYLSPTKIRKGFQLVAMCGAAICTALLSFAGCNALVAIALLAVAMTVLGLIGGGHVSIAVDMAPKYAGTIFGLVNGIGCIAGILSPLVAGLLLDEGHGNISQWNIVFYISAGMYLFGVTVFIIWASADTQEWATSKVTNKNWKITDNKCPLLYKEELEQRFKYGMVS